MAPPQLHMHWEVLLSAGMVATITVVDPGAQGAVVTGTQGMGVSTPSAADVAEATEGLVMDMHMPKGMMFTMGMLSMMFAAGMLEHMVLLVGMTVRVPGAAPKEHISVAPETTS